MKKSKIRDYINKRKDLALVKPVRFIKINEPEVFNVVSFFSDKKFNSPDIVFNGSSIYTVNNDEMEKFLDEFKIYYTVFDSKEELKDYMMNSIKQKK